MVRRKGSPRQKHIPLRTCVACRETKPKRELVRVVLVPDQGLVVDKTGKLNGRGAYICNRYACWLQALERDAIGRALKIKLAPADIAVLETFADSLAQSERCAEPESAENADATT